MTLYCATTNPGKLREFQMAGYSYGIDIQPLPGLETIPPPAETGGSFEENAILKAIYYSRFADQPVFADDSGLEVDALDGRPGVLSARYAGDDATDEANNRRLLEQLRGVSDRRARFVCVIAVARNGRVLKTYRGSVEGHILHEPRGEQGFGYDPLFFYEPFGCTFGEVPSENKMRVSHRGQALRAMLEDFATARVS